MKPVAVIPTYMRNVKEFAVTKKCIDTLRDTSDVFICVVDDCSPDQQTARKLLKTLDIDELILKEKNEGFATTINHGLRLAHKNKSDAILVNADMEFLDNGWLEAMQQNDADVVGALLLYSNGLVQHAGVYYSLIQRVFDHIFRMAPSTLEAVHYKRTCPVTGALQLIRHDTMNKVGFYDEGFCSPPDELVLTSKHGYVPISELDSNEHGLVTVDHNPNGRGGGRIQRGERGNRWGSVRSQGGREFEMAYRPYSGQMLSLQTSSGACARVTPGHRLRVRWTEEALNSYAVYLMRRGNDWRIGTTAMSTRTARTFGPRIRQMMEMADDLWILELCKTRVKAEIREAEISLDYQIPQMLFAAKSNAIRMQKDIDNFWLKRETKFNAINLLNDYNLMIEHPLLRLREKSYAGGTYHGFLTHAANVIDGKMTVDIDPGNGYLREHELVAVDRDIYHGNVYSLDVPPYHYYVSNGIIVHNSMGWEDVSYCHDVFQAGLTCSFEPTAIAIHHESLFRGDNPNKKILRWQEESWNYLHEKHAGQEFSTYTPNGLDGFYHEVKV